MVLYVELAQGFQCLKATVWTTFKGHPVAGSMVLLTSKQEQESWQDERVLNNTSGKQGGHF